MTEKAPLHIQAALRLYDRTLRLRFSKEKQTWLLERRCPQRIILAHFPPIDHYRDQDGVVRERLLPENADLRIQYRDGYVQICETGTPSLRLIRQLWMNDARRFGKNYGRMLAQKWEEDEQLKQMKRREKMEHIGGEMFDSFAWRSGQRMAV